MEYNIAVIRGDGIGPEIVDSALRVLDKIALKYGHVFRYEYCLMGGCAYDEYGVPLPEDTIKTALSSDSVLLGAVGSPKYDNLPGELRPESALLGIRKALELYTNLRPARLFPSLSDDCPLKGDITKSGFDILIVRELTGGIYFGDRGMRNGKYGEEAYDTECYSRMEIERIVRAAFDAAGKRNSRVVSVDKANVLETSRLWRKIVHEISEEYPDIRCTDMLVDNAAMQLIKDPGQFDVIVTSNMFGDILSDEASQLTGSIGLLPSASLGDGKRGLYEPIHGSAPDIAGQNKANPIATILSASMMLRYSFGLNDEADDIDFAVNSVINKGYRTEDINKTGSVSLGCDGMTDLILKEI